MSAEAFTEQQGALIGIYYLDEGRCLRCVLFRVVKGDLITFLSAKIMICKSFIISLPLHNFAVILVRLHKEKYK